MSDMFSDPGVDLESDTAKPSTSRTSEADTWVYILLDGKQFKKQMISYVGSGVTNTRCEVTNI